MALGTVSVPRPPKAPAVPSLTNVSGVPTGLMQPTLGIPRKTLTTLGPRGQTVKASVAQTGRMAKQAGHYPAAPKAPTGGIKQIRVRRLRFRSAPVFTPPTATQSYP